MKKIGLVLALFAGMVIGVDDVEAQNKIWFDSQDMVIRNQDGDDIFELSVWGNGDEYFVADQKRSAITTSVMGYNYQSFFEIGMNMFPMVNYSIYSDLPHNMRDFMDLHNAKSLQVNFSLFDVTMFFNKRKNLAFTAALQLACNNYVFEQNVTLIKVGGMLVPQEISSQYKKSKITTTAFQIPLLFSFGRSRSFHASVGVYGGVILGSHTKIKFPKEKMYSLYMNPFYGGVTARLGFRGLYVYGNYGLSEMFKPGKGPELAPLTVGLGIGF